MSLGNDFPAQRLTTCSRWMEPARTAYESAIEALQKELSLEECQAVWLREQSSMADVQHALGAAMVEYQSRAKASKVRMWLSSCSSRILYYGSELMSMAFHTRPYVC
jgi:hypothetical protein